MMANGVADPIPLRPFRVRVMNLSHVARFLPKDMVLGDAMPHPTRVVTLVDEGERFSLDSGYATPSASPKEEELLTPTESSWKDEIDLAHLELHVRAEVFNLLEPHGRMWDGHWGTITATRHRIDLQPGARPVYSHPYRAGNRARKDEAEEIDRMLRTGVTEPASSE